MPKIECNVLPSLSRMAAMALWAPAIQTSPLDRYKDKGILRRKLFPVPPGAFRKNKRCFVFPSIASHSNLRILCCSIFALGKFSV